MDAEPHDAVPEMGRVAWAEIAGAPHAVVIEVPDLDAARALIEDLENRGIPSNAIALVDAHTKDQSPDDTESDVVAESGAFASLSKSVIGGGFLGMLVGGLLGFLMTLLIPDLEWYWGVVIGGVFGAGVGGAAGGISVAKYSSPAWDETYQVEDEPTVKVAVHHAEAEVVDEAETVMQREVDGEVERFDRSV